MDEDARQRIPTYITSTLHAVHLAELARMHPDPVAYLRELEQKVTLGCDRLRTHDQFPEVLKHGVLEGIGEAFRSARAWLDLLRDDPDSARKP